MQPTAKETVKEPEAKPPTLNLKSFDDVSDSDEEKATPKGIQQIIKKVT